MSPRSFKTILLLMLASGLVFAGFYCSNPEKKESRVAGGDSPWRNVYDTSVHYVGITVCRSCHEPIYNTYIQTGMGQSFAPATRQKSAADFSPAHAHVYDKVKDLHYWPHWEGDSLHILEYRLAGRDTVHTRNETIQYIVGSGQHTNSHIFSSNGYLYQAPITFYTQRQQWDLAPGFENGSSTRFSRLIETECMTCHNGYPEHVAGSQNKYTLLQSGIDCERCHGPGSLHVAEKSAGNIIDTSKGPDYSIVNPRRLTTDMQNNVCQRCHLQGIAVLNPGKTFFDFRPGMRLSEVMNVFMPQYTGADDKMIMASHVERMKKSACYVSSGKMSCITCHNPHVSVRVTPEAQYLNACASCHGLSGNSGSSAQQVHCSESESARAAKGNNCVTCHMPSNGSIDIPHVAVTDHFIRKRPLADRTNSRITAFTGLQCFNNDKVDALTTARAYMEFFERYGSDKRSGSGLIDSALRYIAADRTAETRAGNSDYIRAWFLLGNFGEVIRIAGGTTPAATGDPWTAYRIGEAYQQTGQPDKAETWYARATQLWPLSLDFQSKYAACLLALHKTAQAEKTLRFILEENDRHVSANSNLGFLYLQDNNRPMALEYLKRALSLDPDHEPTLINLAVWFHGQSADDKASQLLQHVLKINPQNERAKAMLLDLR